MRIRACEASARQALYRRRHLSSFGLPANDRASALKRAISGRGWRKSLPRTVTARRRRSDTSSRVAKVANWVKSFSAIDRVGCLGPLRSCESVELLSRWTEKEKDDLLYALQGRGAFRPSADRSRLPQPEPETVLRAIHDLVELRRG